MRTLLVGLVAIGCWVGSSYAAAGTTEHSGGLDRYGCHTDHSTGRYHCHR